MTPASSASELLQPETSEQEYERITYGIPVAAAADPWSSSTPGWTFVYVSGSGRG